MGPPFLKETDIYWPKDNSQTKIVKENSELLEKNTTVLCVNVETCLIDFTRFSSWNRLIRVIERVLQAIDIFQKRNNIGDLRISRAEEICIKLSQINSFLVEITLLKKVKSIPKNSRILSPFLDKNDTLRVESRTIHFPKHHFLSELVILDAEEYFTRLLIKHYHEKY